MSRLKLCREFADLGVWVCWLGGMHAQRCSIFLRAVVCESQTGCFEVVNKGFTGHKQGGNVC